MIYIYILYDVLYIYIYQLPKNHHVMASYSSGHHLYTPSLKRTPHPTPPLNTTSLSSTRPCRGALNVGDHTATAACVAFARTCSGEASCSAPLAALPAVAATCRRKGWTSGHRTGEKVVVKRRSILKSIVLLFTHDMRTS